MLRHQVPHPTVEVGPAGGLQRGVQLGEGGEGRDGHHEVAPAVPDEGLHVALLVAPADPAEPMSEQEVALEAEELPGEGPLSADHLADRDRGVVVGGPGRHPPEERERGHVGGLEGLGALPGVGRDVEGVRVRQAHHRERGLAANPGDLDSRVAEVELGLARWVRQGDEDLLVMAPVPGDGLLHLGDAAWVAVLVPEALEDPLRRVVLLGGRLPVGGQDLLDHRKVRAELGPGARSARPVARRLRVREDLLEGSPADAVLATGRTLRGALDEDPAPDLGPHLHVRVHSFSRLPASLPGSLGASPSRTGMSGCCRFRPAFVRPRVLSFSTGVYTPRRGLPRPRGAHIRLS